MSSTVMDMGALAETLMQKPTYHLYNQTQPNPTQPIQIVYYSHSKSTITIQKTSVFT